MTLLFRPRPLDGESITSVAIRAGAASASTLPSVLKFARQPYQRSDLLFSSALRGERTPLHEIALLDNWAPPQILTELHQQGSLSRWVSFKSARFCPACAEEGILPWIHDVDSVDVCAKHGIRLIDHCESCGDEVRLYRRGLNRCHCGEVMKQRVPADSSALLRSQMISHRFHSADVNQLWPALKIDQMLRERYKIFDIEFDAIFDFLEGVIDGIVPSFLRLAERFPGLPARLLVCPLSKVEDIDERFIARLIEGLNPAISRCSPPTDSDPFLLNLDEAATVLGIKEEDVKFVITALADPTRAQKPSNRRGWSIDLAGLYRKLYFEQFSPGLTRREIGLPFLTMISNVINGDFLVAAFDPTKGLRDIRVSPPIDQQELLCAAEAAKYLNYARSSVVSATSLGLVEHSLIGGTPFFQKSDLDKFSETYVSARSIRKGLDVSASRIAAILSLTDLTAFSDDGSRGHEFFFLRKEYERIDLPASLKANEDFDACPPHPTPYDTADLNSEIEELDYLRDDEAAEYIGIDNRNRLRAFECEKLLVRVHPSFDKIGMRRFYSKASVEAAKGYIEGLDLMKQFSSEMGATLVQLRKRHRRLLDSGHYLNLHDGSDNLLHPVDILKDHFLKYWGAESAAKYLGVSLYTITNWRTGGHLETLQPGEAGFLPETHLYKPENVMSFPERCPDKLTKAQRKFAESPPKIRDKEKRGRRKVVDPAFSATDQG